MKTESEVEFVKGDWTQFTKGDDVAVRYTETGLKDSISSMETQLKHQVTTALRAMLREQLDASGSLQVTCDIEHTRVSNETMVINKETMSLTADGPSDGTVEIKTTVRW